MDMDEWEREKERERRGIYLDLIFEERWVRVSGMGVGACGLERRPGPLRRV